MAKVVITIEDIDAESISVKAECDTEYPIDDPEGATLAQATGIAIMNTLPTGEPKVSKLS
jgi:hypothetical protein